MSLPTRPFITYRSYPMFSLLSRFTASRRNISLKTCSDYHYFLGNNSSRHTFVTCVPNSKQSNVKNYFIHQTRCFSVNTNNFVLWISSSEPVLKCQWLLETAQSTTHLPWWAVIIGSTLILRMLFTFPITIYQHMMIARLENLQPSIKEMAVELRKETAIAAKLYDWPEKYSKFMYNKSLRNHIAKMIERENCHPLKSTVVVLIQLPLWISVSFALRNMVYMMPTHDFAAQMLYLQLAVGGALWFPNLTMVDPTFILPVALGIINLAIIESHALRTAKGSRIQVIMTNFMRLTSVCMIPLAATVPSCMALYWTMSSLFGLVQNLTLSFPRVRRTLHIPQTPKESQEPFQEMLDNLRKKLKI